MTYQAIYKCRLCGEKFVGTLIDKEEAGRAVLSFQKGKHRYKSISGRNDVPKEIFHCCENNSIGIADFQGFKAVQE